MIKKELIKFKLIFFIFKITSRTVNTIEHFLFFIYFNLIFFLILCCYQKFTFISEISLCFVIFLKPKKIKVEFFVFLLILFLFFNIKKFSLRFHFQFSFNFLSFSFIFCDKFNCIIKFFSLLFKNCSFLLIYFPLIPLFFNCHGNEFCSPSCCSILPSSYFLFVFAKEFFFFSLNFILKKKMCKNYYFLYFMLFYFQGMVVVVAFGLCFIFDIFR